MTLSHEKLDVYQLSIKYVTWVYLHANELNGIMRHARDQWLRASQSIPLNIAEGNGKASHGDRRRYFEIARGSANDLDRISAMLSKLGGRGYTVKEEVAEYGASLNDFDSDPDPEH